jgi:hypothetical protein
MNLWLFLLACTAVLGLAGCISSAQAAAEVKPVAQCQNVIAIVNDPGFCPARVAALQDRQWGSGIAAPSRLFKGIIVAPRVPAGTTSDGMAQSPGSDATLLAPVEAPADDSPCARRVDVTAVINSAHFSCDAGEIPASAPQTFEFSGQGSARFVPSKGVRPVGPLGEGQWHLYNAANETGEVHERRGTAPALFAAMMAKSEEYVREHGLNEAAVPGLTPIAGRSARAEVV